MASSVPPPSPAQNHAQPQPSTNTTADLLSHEYDGIREYDNPMPRWWVAIFWGSFVFSIGYFFHYHISGNGTSVADAYTAEVQSAQEVEAKRALSDPVSEESLRKLVSNEVALTEAKIVYASRCAPCHADQGQGLIGPNLTDQYWIHGKGALTEIYQSVDLGVPDKGMPAWGRQLTPPELRKVVALVGSWVGKNLPGKAPQGNRSTP